MCQIWWQKNCAILCCKIPLRAKTRAHYACAKIFFAKCLKWPKTYCKINLIKKWFWAFLNFARELTRGRTHARAFFDLKLTGRILTLIMINMNEKWPFRYEDMIMSKKYQTKHKMAPGWRHEDLMTLKMLLSRLMTMTYNCAKIEGNWLNRSWVILCTKKCEEINKNKE